MNCQQLNKFILDHLGEEVPSDVQDHLNQCESCRDSYAQQQMIKDLFSLRRYEEPKSGRVERGVANIMREVRLNEDRYVYKQNRFLWLFTEPRYGLAMLFFIFIGLNLVKSDRAQYGGNVVSSDLPGSDIMLLSEAPQMTMTNNYNYPEFNIDQVPGMVPQLGPSLKLVNFAE